MEKIAAEELQQRVKVVEGALVSIEEALGKHEHQFAAILAKLESMGPQSGGSNASPEGSSSSTQKGNGSGASNAIQNPKIEFPSFDGTDPIAWLAQAEQYFLVHQTPINDRVQLALVAMTGRSMFWAQWVMRRSATTTWTEFTRELLNRFGDSFAVNAYEAMHLTRQTGSLEDYLSLFEERVAQLPFLSPEQYLGWFLGGLQTELRDSIPDSETTDVYAAIRAARRLARSHRQDSLKQDDVECNGVPYGSLSENKGPLMSTHTKPAEELKTTIQSKDKSFLGLVSRSAREHSSGASIAFPALEGTIVSVFEPGANVVASSVPVFDKPKESLFGLSSKAADKSPLLSSESIRRVESEPERPTSLANISASIGSEVRTPESFHLKPVKAVDTNGKCDDVSSAALNGPLFSSGAPVSFPAASFSDMNRMSTGSAPLFTSSTNIANFVPTGSSTSTAAPSGGSIFGLAVNSSSSVGPVSKPGFSADLSTSVSAPTAASFSERADQKAKIDINPSSGSSTSLYAASSGNGIFKFGSSLSNPTGNSLHGSLFASATKSSVSGVGTLSQGTTTVSVSSASVPAFNMNTSASLGSLPTPSISFGNSTTSPSDTTSVVPAGGPTSSLFKFGATPSAGSEGSAVSSSTTATPSTFVFGFSSSSPSTNTVGSSSGPATPIFGFGGGASVSASAINAASSFGSGASGVFGFGGSSSASSSTSNSLSSSSSNVFGSSWQSPKSPIFGSTLTSASPPTGFSFAASTNAEAPMAFNSSIGASSAPIFSFTSASASALSSLPNTQPIFGNPPTGGSFGASPGNNDQMNAEDSMAEDPVPSSVSNSVFGQPSVSPSPPTFAFGSAAPSQNNPFMFNGQQNQVPPQNPSSFQASSSVEFNSGGSFSLRSGGGDKSGRKIVKVSRNKNRKK